LLKAKGQAQALQLAKQRSDIDKLTSLTNELKRKKGGGNGGGDS
jgi:hypothetical protein